jgi:hypothetical protein
MRDKLLHPATIVALVALLVALDVPSQAARELGLARNSVTSKSIRDGTIRARDLSRRVRRLLARAGTPGPPGTPGAQGPTGPPGPAPSCPTGTILHELKCIETTQRAQANWETARTTCRNAGRRLPSVEELTSFEQRTEDFVPTAGSEWTAMLTDLPASSDVASTIRFTDGELGADDPAVVYNYRCVAQGAL